MGLVDNLAKRFGFVTTKELEKELEQAIKAARNQSPILEVIASRAPREIGETALYENQAKALAISSWVYFCVTRIAEQSALVPLQVKKRISEEELESIPNHDFELLLDHPSDKWSRFELMEATFGSLDLNGNAYWALTLDGQGIPREILPLRPDRVKIIPDKKQWVKGYLYTVEGTKVALDRNEVVHFKRWHPLRDYEGLSPLEAAGFVVEADIQAIKWNARFFRNNATPDAVLRIPAATSDADRDRILKEWEAFHKGTDNVGRLAIVRGDSFNLETIKQSLKDMDFPLLRDKTRREIFNIFGVPEGLYSESATEANATVADKVFLEGTLWPQLVRVAEKVTAEILPRYGENLVSEFEDIRPVNRQLDLQELQAITAGTLDESGLRVPLMTTNEIRARFWDLPPLEEVQAEEGGSQSFTFNQQQSQRAVQEQISNEIRRWKAKAVKRFKEGESPNVEFTSEWIPTETMAEIQTRLAQATTLEEVKGAFNGR